MKYKNYVLDEFQEEAIKNIDLNHSVVVSAATGTGKTLIADYIIDKAVKEGKKVIYTAPIKALSNQKYKDFKKEYGDKVGILTGDLVINDRAPILVMTTEIYRNMLLEHSVVTGLSYVIFDEIHYMNDRERGTVWEESIIFSSKDVRFLCLSATIPNAKEFAMWIQTIKEHRVEVVLNMKRAVPLKHYLFSNEDGPKDPRVMKKIVEMEKAEHRFQNVQRGRMGQRKIHIHTLPPNHLLLVEYLKANDLLNAIFFVLSRRLCGVYGLEASRKFDFTDSKQKARIMEQYSDIIPQRLRSMKSIQQLNSMIVRGVAIHHAGLLPQAKELVETLFEEGLISVLYTTETFAVGINMPARSVCFDSMRKFDGMSFRYLFSKEYHQIAGRAGRRGIDEVGYVFAMIDKKMTDIEKLVSIVSSDSEPIISQFRLGANTVLNLVDNYDAHQIEEILKSNFDYFLKKQHDNKQIRILRSYNNILRKLIKFGYVSESLVLTAKGRIACRLYADELLLTELLFNGVFNHCTETEINIVIGSIVYEPRRADKFHSPRKAHIQINLPKGNAIIDAELNHKNIQLVGDFVHYWSDGGDFKSLIEMTNLLEGDIIRFFRQIIDRLGQIKKAEGTLSDKISNCIARLDRDVVKVEL